MAAQRSVGAHGAATLTATAVVAALLGAALLFALEPLFVKMALPLFGGAPTVWNVAFGFFTTVLLLGYLYAYTLARLALRTQVAVHAVVLLLAAAFLPPRSSPAFVPNGPPEIGVFLLLFERIGLPFLALSATGPLVQAWFFRSSRAPDPYRLFAASNVGSLIALLSYPFLIEPYSGLAVQSSVWTAVYGVFLLAMVACGVSAIRSAPGSAAVFATPAAATPLADAGRRRTLWVILSAVSTVLMLGLTTHLTIEVASLPFVWTLPLALYLLAFVAAFTGARRVPLLAVIPFVVLPVVALLTVHETLSALAYLILTLAAFFVLTFGVIGRLADSRPAPEHLTEFYVWVAGGGAVGGLFAAFVAPEIFPTVAEYPLAIAASCALLPGGVPEASQSMRFWVTEACIAFALVAVIGLLTHFAPMDQAAPEVSVLLWVALATGLCSLFVARRIRFGLCLAAIVLYGVLIFDPSGRVIARERDFFGPKRVTIDPTSRFHYLISGETVHGIQSLDPAETTDPLAYYSRGGPLGDIFKAGARRFDGRNIAVVGLGIGATACYSHAGQSWSFYEIDPQMVAIAKNARLFSVWPSCQDAARIVFGDARISLASEVSRSYALIILDAYNSDQVPVHLLTREALAVYLRQLAPDGVLAFHISNRHFDLVPVLATLADDANLAALGRIGAVPTRPELADGKMPSSWVVMARRGAMLPGLTNDPRWTSLRRDPNLPLWTDDYSSLARILR